MRIYTLFLILIVTQSILLVWANEDNEPHSVDLKKNNQCSAYAFKTVEPFLIRLKIINDQLENCETKDEEIKELKEELNRLRHESDIKDREKQDLKQKLALQETEHQKEISLKETTITGLTTQINFHQKTIELMLTQSNSINNCYQLQKELYENIDKLKVCESQLVSLNNTCKEHNEESDRRNKELVLQLNNSQNNQTQTQENLDLCFNKLKNINKEIEKYIPDSCIPLNNSPGVNKITISELGATDVLCDSQTVGDKDGWIVIQQRINGRESFYKNWKTYRNGFGSYEGDFFIGLEILHHLTKDRQQELYIHLERFDGYIDYARYDNFKVGSEEEDYKLISLGKFSSNGVGDYLRYNENQKFSTYDRDNDIWENNCAVDRRGGWWYKMCTENNLNGEYSDVEKDGLTKVYWTGYRALKGVKMLIRAKHD